MSLLPLVMIAAAATAQDTAFSFVPSDTTGKHVSVLPQPDHHLVYVVLRIRGKAGRRVHVTCRSVVGTTQGGPAEGSTVRKEVDIDGDNEVWAFYLRVPRHATQTMTHQLEFGEVTFDDINLHQVETGVYCWEVRRPGGQSAEFVPQEFGMPLTTRVATVQGGSVTIYAETLMPSAQEGLAAGFVNGLPGLPLDGVRAARRVSQ